MELLHFEDLGDTVSFGCKSSCSSPRRISIATYLRGVSTLISNLKEIGQIFFELER